MPLVIGSSGGNKTVTRMVVGTADGNKDVIAGWIGTADGNKQFLNSSFPLSVAKVGDWEQIPGEGEDLIWICTVEAAPLGGTGPFTYAWSGDAGAAPADPTANPCVFIAGESLPPPGSFHCVATDANGATGSDSAAY